MTFVGRIRETYPHLEWTEQGIEKLREIEKNWDEMPVPARDELHERLAYLDNYGGETEDGFRPFTVQIGSDWAWMSFGLAWFANKRDGSRKPWCYGGLIFHGGTNDPLTVVVGDTHWWGVHT